MTSGNPLIRTTERLRGDVAMNGSHQLRCYLSCRHSGLSREESAALAGMNIEEARLTDIADERGEIVLVLDPMDPLTVRRFVKYEPETGKLYWLERTPDCFTADSHHTPAHQCAKWNGRWAGKEAFTAPSDNGYRRGNFFGATLYAHRVAWCLMHGRWPSDEIDHINGDRADNRGLNLREVTKAENMRNAKLGAANSTGVVGVYRHHDGRWLASIYAGGGQRHLGIFDTKEQATAARKQAEREHGFHPNHGRKSTGDVIMAQPARANDQETTELETPDFERAVNILRSDLNPLTETSAKVRGDQSAAWKAIEKDCRCNKKGMKWVHQLMRMDPEIRDDVLRTLYGGMKAANLGISRDLVDRMGDGDAPEIPTVERKPVELVTVQ